jgi:hypothetical protein
MNQTQSLVSIAQDALALESLILENSGELDATLEQWLDEVQTQLATKTDQYKFVMDRLESSSQFLKAKADEIYDAAKRLETASDRLKQRIKEVMIVTDRSEIHGSHYVFKLSNSTPKMIINESELPTTYKRSVIIQEIDKDLIKSEIKAGNSVPGV